MKIRIKGNTIRLRLTKSEVDYFSINHILEEQTEFPEHIFRYVLRAANQKEISASFDNNTIIISLPMAEALKWTRTQLVSCTGEINLSNNKKLFILIEKDFKCLDESIEDQSDNYENPLASIR